MALRSFIFFHATLFYDMGRHTNTQKVITFNMASIQIQLMVNGILTFRTYKNICYTVLYTTILCNFILNHVID